MGNNAEKIVRYSRGPLTADQIARIDALRNVPDAEIDFSDSADADDDRLATAPRGSMYRAVKRQTTLRLDADILDWFKRHAKNGRGYQTDINAALRRHIAAQEKKAHRKAG